MRLDPGFPGSRHTSAYAVCGRSVRILTKLYAAAANVNIHPVRSTPLNRVLRCSPTVFIHPKTSWCSMAVLRGYRDFRVSEGIEGFVSRRRLCPPDHRLAKGQATRGFLGETKRICTRLSRASAMRFSMESECPS